MVPIVRVRLRAVASAMHGASLTEFIIITPVALLLMLSIVQFGLVYMAKQTLNNATFLAARHGANQRANVNEVQSALIKGLLPFYVNSSGGNVDSGKLLAARAKAMVDVPIFSKIEIISPSPQAFTAFSLIDQNGNKFIPNDNLEYRYADSGNTRSGPDGKPISIRDANVLKIRVVYGYEMKVPLVRTVMKKVMCLGVAGGGEVAAWRAQLVPWDPSNCVYYLAGRIPLESFATVQMQTDAQEGERVAGLGGVGSGTGTGSDTGSDSGGDSDSGGNSSNDGSSDGDSNSDSDGDSGGNGNEDPGDSACPA